MVDVLYFALKGMRTEQREEKIAETLLWIKIDHFRHVSAYRSKMPLTLFMKDIE